MPELRLLEQSSSLVEMGRHYMTTFPHEIQEFTADRLQFSRNKNWQAINWPATNVLSLSPQR